MRRRTAGSHYYVRQASMRLRLTVLLVAVVVSTSCGTRRQPIAPAAVPAAAPIPHFEHVFIVVEENENYDDVIGNTADMPYLNQLATHYGLATNYYANTHPSIN